MSEAENFIKYIKKYIVSSRPDLPQNPVSHIISYKSELYKCNIPKCRYHEFIIKSYNAISYDEINIYELVN
jgi:hypothetical protein